jgi:hypothetical protein
MHKWSVRGPLLLKKFGIVCLPFGVTVAPLFNCGTQFLDVTFLFRARFRQRSFRVRQPRRGRLARRLPAREFGAGLPQQCGRVFGVVELAAGGTLKGIFA